MSNIKEQGGKSFDKNVPCAATAVQMALEYV